MYEIPLLISPEGADARASRVEHFLSHLRGEPGVHLAEVTEHEGQPLLRAEVDPKAVSAGTIERWARHSGLTIRERWAQVVLGVDGMVSRASEGAIESALEGLPNVRVSASFPSRTVRIEFDRTRCQLAEIAMRLSRMGFRLKPLSHRERESEEGLRRFLHVERAWERAWLVFRGLSNNPLAEAVGGAAALIAGFIAERAGAPGWAVFGLYGVSYLAAGSGAARDAVLSLARRQFSIDLLMFVAAIGAGAIGHMAEGALLLTLFAFGHAGEALAMDRAKRAIEGMNQIAPDVATVRTAQGMREVRVEELNVGDVVVIRPGERCPADGVVIVGYSGVDESAITGESTPAEKSEGARVFAGTLNGDGLLEARVEKVAAESTLAKAIRLIEEAQTRRSPTELLAARVERYYVPVVLFATAALLVGGPAAWGWGWPAWKEWFYRSMAFLTAASPCALAISTPAAVLSALARSARMGVLIKGGAHLESLGRLRAVALDKTGTLTEGKPVVVAVDVLSGASEEEALFTAACAEAGSAHPLAEAVCEAASARGWDGVNAERVQQVVGKGLRATAGGEEIEIGSLKMFPDAPSEVRERVSARQREGATVVAVRKSGRFLGVLALRDEPRPDAARLAESLRALGVRRVVMLTGDHEGTASALRERLGLDEHRAELLPEDKVRAIDELRERYGVVAMVGDGVNDAPALAAASVGVAMGAAGSDVALETADVALLRDDLSKFASVVRLAKFARRIVAQNVVIAMGVIVVLAPLAAMGEARIGWAVVFHEGSTVVVVLNALRLLGFRAESGAHEKRRG